MVLWRSTSSFAVLLRVSGYPTKTVPQAVTSAAPLFRAARIRSSPLIPQDDGDHDPEIDLITLRRRVLPDFTPKQSSGVAQKIEPETKSKPNDERPSDRISEPIVIPPPISLPNSTSAIPSNPTEASSP